MILARRAGFALLLLFVGLIGGRALAESPRAQGGVGLLDAIEVAPLTVVASISKIQRLDGSGHDALIEIETVLRARVPPPEPGASLRIAWEELAASRAPRFQPGDRVLVSLEPLPGASIWLRRYPTPEMRSLVMGVAGRGDAFLRNPSAGSIDRLEHLLAQTRTARNGEPGTGVLVELAAGGEIPLAIDAVEHLADRSDLDAMLGPAGARRLVAVLLRRDVTPKLETAVIRLIETAPLPSTRPLLVSLSTGTPRPPASVYAALAVLDGGLSAEQTTKLLEAAPSSYRVVAAANASGDEAVPMLIRLGRSDRDPAVRVAALERLSALEGDASIEWLARSLGDPEASVRRAAVALLADRGESALPTLLLVIDGNDPPAIQSALAAISLSQGPEAQAALVELADTHPDPSVRALAGIALGRPLGDAH